MHNGPIAKKLAFQIGLRTVKRKVPLKFKRKFPLPLLVLQKKTESPPHRNDAEISGWNIEMIPKSLKNDTNGVRKY